MAETQQKENLILPWNTTQLYMEEVKMKNIKLMICDDEAYWCDIFERYLNSIGDMEVVGNCTGGNEITSCVKKCSPDILLLDINLDKKSEGIELIPEILKVKPELKIIMLTSYDDDNYILSSLANGAVEYLIKTTPISQMLEVIRDVYENKSSIRPEIAKRIAREAKNIRDNQQSLLYIIHRMTKLSNGEFQVLKDVYDGLTYNEIAEKRVVEPQSIRMTASRILAKFGMNSMKELVEMLRKMDVFDLFNNL